MRLAEVDHVASIATISGYRLIVETEKRCTAIKDVAEVLKANPEEVRTS